MGVRMRSESGDEDSREKNRKANDNKCVDEQMYETDSTAEMSVLHSACMEGHFSIQAPEHLTK